MTVYAPKSEAEVVGAVRAARASKTPLRIIGGGTRQGLGRPIAPPARLSLAGLSGITLYEPAEMVIGARAGTPLAEVEATLAAKGQMLPFEPLDYAALYGVAGAPSIGAVAALNNSGARRIYAGAARDSLIGVRFVNGMGDVVKSGGRVMKNVTGLDLVKLQAGAHGTLGPLTEVIFKVLPKPETARTLELIGLDDTRAVSALSAGLCTPFEVTGAVHLPATGGRPARTVFRIEGFEESLRYRTGELTRALAAYGAAQVHEAEASAALWADLRCLQPLSAATDVAIWRLSLKPTDGPKVMAALDSAAKALFYDWGGGLIWVSAPAQDDAGAAAIRSAVARFGGHATLMRAPDGLRASVPVFQPEGEAIYRLSTGIRRSIDPDALFNPGLMG